MKASAEKISNLFKNRRFKVPRYQRYYSWEKEDALMLVSDVYDILISENNKHPKHFIGNVVTKFIKRKEFEIIDGQQRLTTIILIAKAMIECWKTNLNLENKNKLENIFLDDKHKLTLTLKNEMTDDFVFRRIINNDTKNLNKNSKILKNFRAIKRNLLERMTDTKDKSDEINKFVKIFLNLDLVFIKLEENDDSAQNVFESLNSKGKELDLVDLIKNYVFMNIKEEQKQISLYENYWSKIEKNITLKEMTNFIRYFTLINQDWKERKYVGTDNKEVYSYFKKVFKNLYREDVVEDLLCKLYELHILYLCVTANINNYQERHSYIGSLEGSKEYLPILRKSRLLLSTGSSSLMNYIYLYLSKLFIDKKISENHLESALKIFENYFFRWIICSGSGNLIQPLTEFVNDIDEEMEKIEKFDSNNSFIKFIKVTIQKNTSDQFRNFTNDYIESQLSQNKKNIKESMILPLLKMVERSMLNSSSLLDNDLTKEHILPRSYEAAAKNDFRLKEIGEKTYDSYKSSFGNFLLLDKKINKQLGSNNFPEKIKILEDYKNGINQYCKITKMMNEFISFREKNCIEEWNIEWISKWNKDVLTPNLIKYLDRENF